MRNLIALLLGLITLSTVSIGETIHVPGDYPTIQAGIDASSDYDTVLVADGTHASVYYMGIDFTGKAIVVISENGPENCIIDCGSSVRGFYFHSGETAASVLSGFTIRNGFSAYYWQVSGGAGLLCTEGTSPRIINCHFENCAADENGGGICCNLNSNPLIINCTFSNNSAYYGGGIYCSENTNAITGCIFTGNSAVENGGGICCFSVTDVVIANCTFTENSAMFGGGIKCWNTSSPSIYGCHISGNYADNGGGIDCAYWCIPYISDCELTDNTAEDYGGGINCLQSDPIISDCIISGNSVISEYEIPRGGGISCKESNPQITDCIISDNSAESGAGISCTDSSNPVIIGCTLSGNTANIESGGGGGIDCYQSNPSITKCSIIGNFAYRGGGISMYNSGSIITNCTISGNTAEGGGMILWESNPIITNTIVEGNYGTCGVQFVVSYSTEVLFSDFHNNEGGDFTGGIPPGLGVITGVNANGHHCDDFFNIFEDPLFEDPVNGNFQITWANFPVVDSTKSPCIDAGDPASPLDPDSTIADIGAFFFNQTAVYANLPDINPPTGYVFYPPYPNPFNQSTAISFELRDASFVNLTIYDLAGREVAKLVEEYRNAGTHEVNFDGSDLASGIYFARLEAGEFVKTHKMLLVK